MDNAITIDYINKRIEVGNNCSGSNDNVLEVGSASSSPNIKLNYTLRAEQFTSGLSIGLNISVQSSSEAAYLPIQGLVNVVLAGVTHSYVTVLKGDSDKSVASVVINIPTQIALTAESVGFGSEGLYLNKGTDAVIQPFYLDIDMKELIAASTEGVTGNIFVTPINSKLTFCADWDGNLDIVGKYKQNGTEIGKITPAEYADYKSLPAGTTTVLTSVTLSKGSYILQGNAHFNELSSAGRRFLSISTNTTMNFQSYSEGYAPANNAVYVNLSRIIEVTSDNTKVNLLGYCSSAITVNNSYLKAIKVG